MKTKSLKTLPACELLERRLAPAGLFTFTDVDGDLVTVKTSKGVNTDLQAALTLSGGSSGQLQAVNLAANPVFAGTDFSVAVKKAGGGDGFAAVGEINATNVDVGKISIHGDLGRIVAGDADPATPGVVALAVASLGRYGTTTGAPDLASGIRGDLVTLKVNGDVQQAQVTIIGGGIGTLTIGGSLVGGDAAESGRIVGSRIGSLEVGRSIVGGMGARSASVSSADSIGSVSVGTSILGGDGNDSGAVVAAKTIGSLNVGRDVVGGSGSRSGSVTIGLLEGNGIGNVRIGGSVVGGAGTMSATIYGVGVVGSPSVTIGGDVRGGGGQFSGAMVMKSAKTVSVGGSLIGGDGSQSGAVFAQDSIGSVSIRGSILGGSGFGSGSLRRGAVAGTIGNVLVGGSLVGGSGEQSGTVWNETGEITKTTIRGSITGGTGNLGSGTVFAEVLGAVSVGGNVTGGAGSRSGSVAGTTVKSVSIKGSLNGGAGETSGCLVGSDALGTVSVGKNVGGGLGKLSGSLLSPVGSIAKATVGGSVTGGTGLGSATIGAARNIVSLAVKGGMVGTAAYQPVHVVAGGLQGSSGIGTVTVGGSVASTVFLAGWQPNFVSGLPDPANGNGSIGTISVKGNFTTSSIAAGINAILYPFFGSLLDATIQGGTTCAIGSVSIGGKVIGSADSNQFFGIESRQIGSVKIKGVKVPIPAAGAATPIGASPNVFLRVVSV